MSFRKTAKETQTGTECPSGVLLGAAFRVITCESVMLVSDRDDVFDWLRIHADDIVVVIAVIQSSTSFTKVSALTKRGVFNVFLDNRFEKLA